LGLRLRRRFRWPPVRWWYLQHLLPFGTTRSLTLFFFIAPLFPLRLL
jgi:hypothetical protein